ncbi:hypothetical protein SLEP1_g51965 [Rubroshorea leprosula]|uniref:Uncharacterized protein n=1 Tax=Rubroshorea leprosula TaxID=152421 RepID=A0AAV5M739_9ROSI|nr:hypothetical protein SLEP1_g51965 [Rubroshorea leprosula]
MSVFKNFYNGIQLSSLFGVVMTYGKHPNILHLHVSMKHLYLHNF